MATVTGLTAERMLEIEAATVVSGLVADGKLTLTTHGGTEIDAGDIIDAIPDATESVKGVVELASNAEVATGTDATLVVTPAGLASLLATLIASATARGMVELATNAETATGTDDTRAVTPASLAALVASETAKGIVELATNAETATGSDTTRAVTPAGLASVLSGKQASDSDLTAIAGLSPSNDDIIQRKSGSWTNRTMAQLATDLTGTGEFLEVRLHNGSSYVDADTTNIYIGSVDPGSVANGSIWLDTSS